MHSSFCMIVIFDVVPGTHYALGHGWSVDYDSYITRECTVV